MNENDMNEQGMLTVLLPKALLEDFRLASRVRGETMSVVVRRMIRDVVQEEKKNAPHLFKRRERAAA